MASEVDNGMLEPLSAYHTKYKDEFKANAEELFEELTKKSGIDVEANRDTVKKIKKLDKDIELSEKQKRKLQRIRNFLILVTVLFIIGSIISYVLKDSLGDYYVAVFSTLVGFSCVFAILTLLLHCMYFSKRIKGLQDLLNELRAKRDGLIKLAYEQMAALNALFDWNIPAHLIEKTVKIIDMDQYFDARKAAYLQKKYGYEASDQDSSTVYVQSGNILGNPFLLCRDYRMRMINKTYEGSITIHWTTTVKTQNGYSTQHHTQTLRAYVTAPAPSYNYVSYLVYGNDAAPKLVFSRGPSGMTGKTDKEVKKFVKNRSKELVKKAEKALVKGGTYQTFGNPEFEAIFGGTDRNNELEYRLLFTPLAQKNLLNLIRNGKPYGDDFSFRKNHCLNFIQTRHGQSFNYFTNPTIFVNYDYDACKEFFIKYNCQYFESFYFEMAPLMCVPLYQQHKSIEYLYEEEIDANFADFEYEQMANSFNVNELKHPESITGNIFKTRREKTIGNSDKVIVTAHSFRGEPRVTYVNKRGGDGKIHTIPVHWIEYFPVEQETEMLVSKAETTRFQYNIKARTNEFLDSIKNIAKSNSYHFERCVFATLLLSDCPDSSIESFNGVLQQGTSSVQTLDEMLKSLDSELLQSKVIAATQNVGDEINKEDIKGEAKEVSEEEANVVDEEEANKLNAEQNKDELADPTDEELENPKEESDSSDETADVESNDEESNESDDSEEDSLEKTNSDEESTDKPQDEENN